MSAAPVVPERGAVDGDAKPSASNRTDEGLSSSTDLRETALRVKPVRGEWFTPSVLVLDLLAIGVFGISGGLTAVRMRLDFVGVVALATLTGLGGGWIRDVLIGATPPAALADWRYLVTPLAAGVATFFLHPAFGRMKSAINVFDAFGLGLFSAAGALTASHHGLGPLPATLLGVVTGVGGGVLRDVSTGQVPSVFRKGELYATPATVGAAIVATGYHLGAPTLTVVVAGATVTIIWRLLAIWRRWTAPEPPGTFIPPHDLNGS
jgi:uncharacterized membrane protein YeiH